MEDVASKMKALFARAKATREETSSSVASVAQDAAESLTVPRCAHCGAPREAEVGRAVQGALARACRYCNTREEG